MRICQYFDEHVAELYQAVTTCARSLSEHLPGDAIRKKRDYTAKNYPKLYDHALDRAKDQHTAADPVHES